MKSERQECVWPCVRQTHLRTHHNDAAHAQSLPEGGFRPVPLSLPTRLIPAQNRPHHFGLPPQQACASRASAHQGLQRGHDAEGDSRDDALELAQLAEEAEEAEGAQDPELLDPAVGSAPQALVLGSRGFGGRGKQNRRSEIELRNG